MADKPVGTDLVTKLNAANMQPIWDMVWDGLGETPVPTNVRAHIQAQPVSPSDGKVYVASGGGWVAQNPQDIAGALAGKLDIAGGTIQGALRVNGAVTLDSPATVPVGATGTQVPQVQEVVKKSGDTMTGPLSVPAGASAAQAPQVQEVVKKSGDTMTGPLTIHSIVGRKSNPGAGEVGEAFAVQVYSGVATWGAAEHTIDNALPIVLTEGVWLMHTTMSVSVAAQATPAQISLRPIQVVDCIKTWFGGTWQGMLYANSKIALEYGEIVVNNSGQSQTITQSKVNVQAAGFTPSECSIYITGVRIA